MAQFKYQRLPTDSPGQEPRKDYTAFTHRVALKFCNIKSKFRASVTRGLSIRKKHRTTPVLNIGETSENIDTAVDIITTEQALKRRGSLRVVFKDVASFLSRSGTLKDNADKERPEPLVPRTRFRMILVKKTAKNVLKLDEHPLECCKSSRNSFLANTKSIVRSLGPRASRPFPKDKVKVEKEALKLTDCEVSDTEKELSGGKDSTSQLLLRFTSEVSVSVSPSCSANYTDMVNQEPVCADTFAINDELPSLVDASVEEESLYTLENVPAMVTDFLMPQKICIPKSAGFSIMFEEMENSLEMERSEKIVVDEFHEPKGFVDETLAVDDKKEEKPSVPFAPLCKPMKYPSAAVIPVLPVYDFSSLLHPSMRCEYEQVRCESRGPSFVYINKVEKFARKGKKTGFAMPHIRSAAKDEDPMEMHTNAIPVISESTQEIQKSPGILAPVPRRTSRFTESFLSSEASPVEAGSAQISLAKLPVSTTKKAEQVEPKKKRKHKARAKKGKKGRNKLRVGQKRV